MPKGDTAPPALLFATTYPSADSTQPHPQLFANPVSISLSNPLTVVANHQCRKNGQHIIGAAPSDAYIDHSAMGHSPTRSIHPPVLAMSSVHIFDHSRACVYVCQRWADHKPVHNNNDGGQNPHNIMTTL